MSRIWTSTRRVLVAVLLLAAVALLGCSASSVAGSPVAGVAAPATSGAATTSGGNPTPPSAYPGARVIDKKSEWYSVPDCHLDFDLRAWVLSKYPDVADQGPEDYFVTPETVTCEVAYHEDQPNAGVLRLTKEFSLLDAAIGSRRDAVTKKDVGGVALYGQAADSSDDVLDQVGFAWVAAPNDEPATYFVECQFTACEYGLEALSTDLIADLYR